jgi:hypothetical protein
MFRFLSLPGEATYALLDLHAVSYRCGLFGAGRATVTVIGTEAVELVPRVAAQIKELKHPKAPC